MPASHAARRASVALSSDPSSSLAVPIWARSTSRSVVTTTWGRCPPLSGSWSHASASRQTSTRASARRWVGVRRSVPPPRGVHSGSIAALTTAASPALSQPESRTLPARYRLGEMLARGAASLGPPEPILFPRLGLIGSDDLEQPL